MERTIAAGVALSVILLSQLAHAQAPAPVPAAPVTVWQRLGIPQGYRRIRDARSNRRGNRPQAERTDPLLRLADPKNLESENPAVKLAAEIKKEEDLAPQKIKALKYLAEVGCGCYPGVAEALAAATEDCTEEVRLAAAESIQEASGNHCSTCNGTCCTEELVQQVAKRAYEKDDNGCWLEPSEEVREALREALRACCPGGPPLNVLPPESTPTTNGGPKQDTRPGQDGDDPPPMPPPTDNPEGEGVAPKVTSRRSDLATKSLAPKFDVRTQQSLGQFIRLEPSRQSSRRGWTNRLVATGQVTDQAPVPPTEASVASARRTVTTPEPAELQQPAAAPVPPKYHRVDGYVERVDTRTGMVVISCPDGMKADVGRSIPVFHHYVVGRKKVGSLRIVHAKPGEIIAQPLTLSGRVSKGDEVKLNAFKVR